MISEYQQLHFIGLNCCINSKGTLAEVGSWTIKRFFKKAINADDNITDRHGLSTILTIHRYFRASTHCRYTINIYNFEICTNDYYRYWYSLIQRGALLPPTVLSTSLTSSSPCLSQLPSFNQRICNWQWDSLLNYHACMGQLVGARNAWHNQ